MSPQQLRAVVPIMVLLGIGSSSCSSEGPLPVGGSERGDPPAEQGEALHYFCVDHPCADLHPKKAGECARVFGSNTMMVPIENLGPINAGGSTARFWLDFYKVERFFAVPPIDANSLYPGVPGDPDPGWYALQIPLPAECTSGVGCVWHVDVDYHDEKRFFEKVWETNESNNSATGACIR